MKNIGISLLWLAMTLPVSSFAQQTPETTAPPPIDQAVTCSVHDAWVLGGKTENGFFQIVEELADLAAQKRGLTLPDNEATGQQFGWQRQVGAEDVRLHRGLVTVTRDAVEAHGGIEADSVLRGALPIEVGAAAAAAAAGAPHVGRGAAGGERVDRAARRIGLRQVTGVGVEVTADQPDRALPLDHSADRRGPG